MSYIEDKIKERIEQISPSTTSFDDESLDASDRLDKANELKKILTDVVNNGLRPTNLVLPYEANGVSSEIHICAIPEDFITKYTEGGEPKTTNLSRIHGHIVRSDGQVHQIGDISRHLINKNAPNNSRIKQRPVTKGSGVYGQTHFDKSVLVPSSEVADINPEVLIEHLSNSFGTLSSFLEGRSYAIDTPPIYQPGVSAEITNKDFRMDHHTYPLRTVGEHIDLSSGTTFEASKDGSYGRTQLTDLVDSPIKTGIESRFRIAPTLSLNTFGRLAIREGTINRFLGDQVGDFDINAINAEYGTEYPNDEPLSNILTELYEESIAQSIKGYTATLNAQIEIKYAQAGIERPSVDSEDLYPSLVENFIVSGRTPEVIKYRKEFIDRIYEQLYGEIDLTKESLLSDGYSSSRTLSFSMARVWDDFLRNPKSPWMDSNRLRTIDSETVDLIDKGVFPWREVAKKLGFETISKKQFQSAMRAVGFVNRRSHRYTDSFPQSLSLQDCLALSKFPPNWFDLDKDLTKLALFSNNMLKHLIGTGKKIDHFQATKDKQGLAQLNGRHKWMAHTTPEQLEDKLSAFDEKYKFVAEYSDYAKILSDVIECVSLRVILDSDFDDPEACIDFDYSMNEISINETELYRNFIEKQNRDYEPEWDEDEGEYIEHDFADLYPEIEMVDGRSVLSAAQNHFDVKTFAEKNNALHNAYNGFIQESNRHSDVNYEWTGLTDDPVMHEDFLFVPLNDRLSLLNEGIVQEHCVFSYLGPCLSGDSSIVSVRDPETKEILATVEFKLNDETEVGLDLEIEQCYGVGNTTVSSRLNDAVHSFAQKISAGEIPANNFTEQEGIDPGIIDNVESYPLTEGAVVKSIPYDTDAAYHAFFFALKYLPEEDPIAVMFPNETSMEMFYASEFGKDIRVLQSLGRKFEMPAEKVLVALRADPEFGDRSISWPENETLAEKSLTRRVDIRNTIQDGFKELPGHFTGEQAANQVSAHLRESLGVVIEPSALLEAKEKNNIDAIAFETQLDNGRQEVVPPHQPQREFSNDMQRPAI